MSVILHVLWAEDGVADLGLLERNFITEQWVRKEIEVIAVRGLVVDGAVAFVSVQVDQVGIILAIVEAVGCAWVTLLEQFWDVSTLHGGNVEKGDT